jgi:hypothetical protein
VHMGLLLGENFMLDELAEDCMRDGVYECCLPACRCRSPERWPDRCTQPRWSECFDGLACLCRLRSWRRRPVARAPDPAPRSARGARSRAIVRARCGTAWLHAVGYQPADRLAIARRGAAARRAAGRAEAGQPHVRWIAAPRTRQHGPHPACGRTCRSRRAAAGETRSTCKCGRRERFTIEYVTGTC